MSSLEYNLPLALKRVSFPVIGAPLFIISNPKLIIAQCTSGIVGAMPALNARPAGQLDEWLAEIVEGLASWDKKHPEQLSAPFAINQIVHKTNKRLEQDMQACIKYKVPIIISSLGARKEINDVAHEYGAIVLHDVINNQFARKAIEKGADGLVAVAAGAGGHAGTKSPFALMQEIRQWFSGPLALSGSIASGSSILAARALGANFAYIGSAFIATQEARAVDEYKRAIINATSDDIVYSNFFTGVHANYLASSIRASGLDPDNLPISEAKSMNFAYTNSRPKAWSEIWGSGQGIGVVDQILPANSLIMRWRKEYEVAYKRLLYL